MEKRSVSRREFLGLGAGLAGVGLLASCGRNLPEIQAGKPIVEEGKLKPNSAFFFEDADTGDARVLMRLPDGEFALLSAECTHRSCTVEYKPEEGFLECPCHGSTYDPESGALFDGPADEPLKKLGVKVEGGKVFST